MLILAGLTLLLIPAAGVAEPPGRPQRPALIRDTDAAEGKDEPAVEKEKPYDPLMAEKTLKIGDFYMKRKNFAAAAERYIEALQYQPDLVDAFDALGKAYEKMGDWAKATAVYKDFISKNPDSPKTPEFRTKLARLEKKS